MSWVYDLTIVFYALSVLLYFIDFLHNNRKANRIAFWLLSIVWILQTFFIILRTIDTGTIPLLTILESLYFYSWVLITLSLVINRLVRVDFIVFFTNVLGFFIMSLHTFAPAQHQSTILAEQLISELLFIHITIAILSYGAFSISFVFSILYLIQFNLLKKKKWGKRLIRLGDLSKLDYMSNVLNVIGVPMLLLSLILGLIWAYINLDPFHWYDTKVIGSFIVLTTYSYILYLRVGKGLEGKSMATWNVAAFLALLINFFLFGSLSRFHIWYT